MTDIPVDIGLIYEGERIRKANMYADLAGPKAFGAELFLVKPPEEVEDGKVEVIGPDIPDMEEGSRHPFGMLLVAAGTTLEEDLEGVFERRVHDFCNYIQGFMHLNSRDIIWCRVGKDAAKKGLTFQHIGKALIDLFKSDFDVIEKMQVTFYTEDEAVTKHVEAAREVFEKRDSRARGLKDEDVDVFYLCTLCQSFAPKHVCTITPSRTSSCGSISWFEGRAAVKVDPQGPLKEIPKGEELDPLRGEFSGANEATAEYSNGEVSRVYLHSVFGHPHTSCGCFEAIAFYIPEADGIGVVHRDFAGTTPFGIPFSTMAGQTGGGQQLEGFAGIAIEYLRSPKFFQADGGWERTVWLPKSLKDRVAEAIPEDIRDKIATEEDATDLDSLREFLKKKNHPVVQRWEAEEAPAEEAPAAEAPAQAAPAVQPQAVAAPQAMATMQLPEFTIPAAPAGGAGGGITITFKNAKIYAEKIIISKKK
jgi:acetyl-CoA decarbonylase/synthase complex subunit beta